MQRRYVYCLAYLVLKRLIASAFVSNTGLRRLNSVSIAKSQHGKIFLESSLHVDKFKGEKVKTSFDLDYYDPNEIHPKTKPLPASFAFYVKFLVKLVHEQRRRSKLLRLRQHLKEKSGYAQWRRALSNLNEQRKNLVALADYSASIVVPSFTFLTLGALMTSVIPLYYAKCIQLVATLDGSASKVAEALVGLAITSTLGAFFTGCRGSLFWIAGTRANYNIRVKLHRSLLLQEAAFFDKNEVGYLLSRLNNDVNKIGMVVSYHVNVVLRQLAQFLFGSAYLIAISPNLSMWAFSGIGLVGYVSFLYGTFNRELAQRVQDTLAEGTAVAETSFSMSQTIRAFNGVKAESEKYEAAQAKALELEEVQAWGYGTHKFVSDTLQAALQVMLLFMCWKVGRLGNLPAAQLTTFMFYTNFVLESSNEVGDQWARIQGAVGASKSVFDLIRRVPLVRDPPSKATKRVNGVTTSTNGSSQTISYEPPIIEMDQATIQYGSMDLPALDKVDLKVYPGDKIAIVGRSGSGKSTLLRSIMRFYDPSDGSIKLQGLPLVNMSRAEISKKISIVSQEPELFPMSLLENVLYGIDKDSINANGQPCYSDELRRSAEKSLALAGLPVHNENDLNLDLDTRVGEGGRALSGGQRQRVAIARALIRQPEVLLLDEPTAALDSQSEKAVIGALKEAMEYAKSMVMVTHRLGIVSALGVNRVIVLDKGKIAESGHPDLLLRRPDSLFAGLAREQGIMSKNTELKV